MRTATVRRFAASRHAASLLAVFGLGCAAVQPDADVLTLWQQDYPLTYRIPTIISDGERLLVFAERRSCPSDLCATTIVGKMVMESDAADLATIDLGDVILANPQPIMHEGVLRLVFNRRPPKTATGALCRSPRISEVLVATSYDYGSSWESIESVTDQWYAATGAHNIVVSPTSGFSSGGAMYASAFNRLDSSYPACDNIDHAGDYSFLMASYDGGATWHEAARAALGTNENVALLTDGGALFWSRNYGGGNRALEIGAHQQQVAIAIPKVHSGFALVDGRQVATYPMSDTRENLVIHWLGLDPVTLHETAAGYSNIAVHQSRLHVIYEGGLTDPRENIFLRRL